MLSSQQKLQKRLVRMYVGRGLSQRALADLLGVGQPYFGPGGDGSAADFEAGSGSAVEQGQAGLISRILRWAYAQLLAV